jgi:hypothetical protein
VTYLKDRWKSYGGGGSGVIGTGFATVGEICAGSVGMDPSKVGW